MQKFQHETFNKITSAWRRLKLLNKTLANFFNCYKIIPKQRYANETIQNRLKTRSRNVNSPTSNQPCHLPLFYFREFSSGKSFLLLFSLDWKCLNWQKIKQLHFKFRTELSVFLSHSLSSPSFHPPSRYRFNLFNVELSIQHLSNQNNQIVSKSAFFSRKKKQIIFALRRCRLSSLTTILKTSHKIIHYKSILKSENSKVTRNSAISIFCFYEEHMLLLPLKLNVFDNESSIILASKMG